MAFYRVSSEAYEEFASELDPDQLPPTGDFEYHAESGRFAPEELRPVARVILDALVAAGVTRFRVRYDGGFDEGFAYSDALVFGEESRTPEAVIQQVATSELVSRVREAAGRGSLWSSAEEMYAEASPGEVATFALDELAGELATSLLGKGFGTGEYQLYGAFVADLKTGELIDDPNAPQPEEME